MLQRWTPGRLSRRAALGALAGLAAATRARAEGGVDVDLALVLAIDCSFSVDSNEYALQMQGLAQAFFSADVREAIAAGKNGRIAVSAFHWSDADNQQVILPWMVVTGKSDAEEAGAKLATTPRRLAPGGTGIGAAMLFGMTLLASAPQAQRRVIDVSSDGRNNVGPSAPRVRDVLVAQGITINGLVIRNEWPTLDVYFQDHVVGGDGHFVITADDYEAYAEAILRKLVREITGPGVA